MKQSQNHRASRVGANVKEPSKALLAKLRPHRRSAPPVRDDPALSEAYREVLRAYLSLASLGASPGLRWKQVARQALSYLGGQADRHISSLAEYDHHLYGPYLGISDEGGAAEAIRRAASATPKARALGSKASPLTVGVALDAERLGSIGEVPVGPDEYADIWTECAGRTLLSTNVGSRANVRFFNRAQRVIIPAGNVDDSLATTKTGLAAAFKPFFEAPGGPRPVVVLVEFEFGSEFTPDDRKSALQGLLTYVRTSGIAAPKIQSLGLCVQIDLGQSGQETAMRAIDLAHTVGIKHVAIDGTVREEAGPVISLPGLLDFLPPELVGPLLKYAQNKKIDVKSINVVDSGTVAREIWAGLNAARSMGLDLGKYGLFPLSLEEYDSVARQVQQWFGDWSAAPVFYVDQGLISSTQVYTGADTAKGIEAWLRVMARHKVRVVLIDTVDKSKSWKILKLDNDPKGILEPKQIANLTALGEKLGIGVLWAGGISLEQAPLFGTLGVFGIYVTTAVSQAAPVTGTYMDDPELAAEKRPTFAGVVRMKTVLEAGFLLERLNASPQIQAEIRDAGNDPIALGKVLPQAWKAWWKQGYSKKRIRNRC